MASPYDKERLRYLAGQIAGMFYGNISSAQLGSIALEVLVVRENVEDIIKGKFSKEDKERAKKTLEELKQIQKSIVRLYILTRLGRAQRKKTPFFDHVISKYSSTH